jgi:soluble lytic murein transglycosylase-like protein
MMEIMLKIMGNGKKGASGDSSAPSGGSSGGQAASTGAPAANPNQEISSVGPNPGKAQIERLLEQAAAKYGIPPDILKAVAWKESNWNPGSVGDGGKSHGIMQIYSTAHPDYDVARGKADVAYNIEYGAKFLAGLYKRYGNWQEAVVHYNGSGPAAVAYGSSVMSLAQQKPWG